MKKYLDYLTNAAVVVYCVGFSWNAVKGYAGKMPHGEIGTWLIIIGVLLMLPRIIYNFCHWSEYKEQNIWEIITIVTLILIGIWFIYR